MDNYFFLDPFFFQTMHVYGTVMQYSNPILMLIQSLGFGRLENKLGLGFF